MAARSAGRVREMNEVAAVGGMDVFALELDAVARGETEPRSPARQVVNDVNGSGPAHFGGAVIGGEASRQDDHVELLEFAAIGMRHLPGRGRDARGRDDLLVRTLARSMASLGDPTGDHEGKEGAGQRRDSSHTPILQGEGKDGRETGRISRPRGGRSQAREQRRTGFAASFMDFTEHRETTGTEREASPASVPLHASAAARIDLLVSGAIPDMTVA